MTLSQLFENNYPLVIFIYGMSFFILGFVIYMQSRDFSRLKLASHIRLLATFGIVHGISEWGLLFIPLQKPALSSPAVALLWAAEDFLWAISFLALFLFGLYLLIDQYPRFRRLQSVPWFIFILWSGWFISGFYISPWEHPEHTLQILRDGEISARYLLGFPGSALAALGLWAGRKELIELGGRKTLIHNGFAVAGLMLYAFLGGLVVPPADFMPASLLNTATFVDLTGIPIQIFRAFIALIVTYGVIGLLHIFNLENRRMWANSARIQAIHEERLRIARDLHDGAIQSFYGVALHLQRMKLLRQGDSYLQDELKGLLQEISRAIQELRGFIANLKEPDECGLAERLRDLMALFERSTGISSTVKVLGSATWKLSPAAVSEVYLIVRECVNNAARHGSPSNVEVVYMKDDEGVDVEVRDDGCGFNLNEVKYGSGLENIRIRTRELGGDILISSSPGHGTLVEIRLSKEVVANGQGETDHCRGSSTGAAGIGSNPGSSPGTGSNWPGGFR
ncbi:MAG: sensor histidine kinase [Bacillota bacterium]